MFEFLARDNTLVPDSAIRIASKVKFLKSRAQADDFELTLKDLSKLI